MFPRIHWVTPQPSSLLTVAPNMLRWLNKRTETGRRAKELYGSVVTAARQPDFYGAIGVPDTPEGRFELVALHLYLALEGLRGTVPDAAGLSQRMIEIFVEDMDDCMREMGIGDLAVPKKVKRAAAAFYERATIYQSSVADIEDGRLAANLEHYALPGAAKRQDAERALANYVRAASSALAVVPFDVWVQSGAAAQLLDASTSMIGQHSMIGKTET
ncbi:ubiquinol-cytochrome C chaperone family protein [Hyphomicrobium sp. B1]